MVALRNKVVNAILMISQTTTLIHCLCEFHSAIPYFSVYYPEINKNFFVEFRGFLPVNQTWSKNGRPLVVARCTNNDHENCTEPIYSHFVDLHFKNINLNDSGKYILEVFCSSGARRVNSFEIIVQENPFVHSDCKDMTVYEGENVTCVCKTTSGYAPSVVTWTPFNSKEEQKDILVLQHVSQNESGVYTCVARSRNFVNKTSFRLNVLPKTTKVEIEYFKVFQEIGPGYTKMLVILVCKASGISEDKYTILHQGVTVEYGSMFTVDLDKESNLGLYECLVKDIGYTSDRRVLFLNSSFPVKQCSNDHKKMVSELKMFLIIGICSFITGILALAILVCCCKKCTTNKDEKKCNECHDDLKTRLHEKSARSENVELQSRYSRCNKYDEPEHGNEDDYTYYNDYI